MHVTIHCRVSTFIVVFLRYHCGSDHSVYASATDGCSRCIMFSGCLSVSVSVRVSGPACCQRDILRTSGRNYTKLWLMMYSRRHINCRLRFEDQGHSKVKHLSETDGVTNIDAWVLKQQPIISFGLFLHILCLRPPIGVVEAEQDRNTLSLADDNDVNNHNSLCYCYCVINFTVCNWNSVVNSPVASSLCDVTAFDVIYLYHNVQSASFVFVNTC